MEIYISVIKTYQHEHNKLYLLKFVENPRKKQLQLAMLVFFKNHTSTWVFNKIDKQLKPIVKEHGNVELSSSVVTLVGKTVSQFDTRTDACIIKNIEIWLRTLHNGKFS